MKKPPSLSKRTYGEGLRCHLCLWYSCYDRDRASPVSAATQAKFDTGHEVGRWALLRHPRGAMIGADHFHHEESVELTRQAMEDRKIPAIFEAGLIYQNVRVRADILARAPRGKWDLFEVKSSADVKPYQEDDIALQYWVVTGSGVPIRNACVLTINSDYVYGGGAYDVQKLFAVHDLTEHCKATTSAVETNTATLRKMLRARKAPEIAVGRHCFKPHECQYYAHCIEGIELPENPISDLPHLAGKRLAGLEDAGIETIEEIPIDYALTDNQDAIRRAVQSGKPLTSAKFSEMLRQPNYPIHYLDFESINPTLPRYVGTRPFQQLPFQWSNHIQKKNGSIEHHEYLCREDIDPRVEFIETLLESLGDRGSICVYTNYEATRLRKLAEELPQYAERIASVIERIWDLAEIFKRKHYYHPGFHGSYSLKKVLPVLVPSMSYDGMDVADGFAAQRAYIEAITTNDLNLRETIQSALLEYCGQDTLAMVEMRKVLENAL